MVESQCYFRRTLLYLHYQASICTITLQIHAQTGKSGGSGDGGDTFDVYSKDSIKQADAKIES